MLPWGGSFRRKKGKFPVSQASDPRPGARVPKGQGNRMVNRAWSRLSIYQVQPHRRQPSSLSHQDFKGKEEPTRQIKTAKECPQISRLLSSPEQSRKERGQAGWQGAGSWAAALRRASSSYHPAWKGSPHSSAGLLPVACTPIPQTSHHLRALATCR